MARWQENTLRLAGSIATGVLYAASVPPVGWWPLAFICLTPLLLAMSGCGPIRRVGLAVAAALCAAVACTTLPTAGGASRFLDIPYWQGLILLVSVGLLFGTVGFGPFGLLVGDLRRQPAGLLMARVGAAFAVGEFARTQVFTGLPWVLLGHGLAANPGLVQLAVVGGTPLLSAWLAATSAGFMLVLRGRVAAGLSGLAVLAGAAMLASVWGGWWGAEVGAPGSVKVSGSARPEPGWVRVALVQPGLSREQWSDPSHAPKSVDHMTSLSLDAIRDRHVDLVVWPENALQVYLPTNRSLIDRARERLSPHVDHLLLGAPRFDSAGDGQRFNSALLYSTDQQAPLAIHDKVHLLPLFEYQPSWLPRLGDRAADLSPGERPRVLAMDEVKLGPLICYEALFPEIARSLVDDGAGVLFNLSNDAWFATDGGAEQHFSAVIVRAASLRRPVLRSTPTGITAAIDAKGRVVARLPLDAPGVLLVDLVPSSEITLHQVLGDTVAWIALAFCFTGLLRERIARPA